MRTAVITQYIHHVGGVETYLEHVLPALAARGHSVSVWHQVARAPQRERCIPASIHAHHLRDNSIDHRIARLAGWKPAVLFLHGLSEPALESRLAKIAPTVTFLHDYHGTCVSRMKTHMFPTPQPCLRVLGPGCLLQYYPRRCGGWHPLTMVSDYRAQRERQAFLTRSAFVATFSEHMRLTAIANGVDPSRAVRLPVFTPPEPPEPPEATEAAEGTGNNGDTETRRFSGSFHLVFVGRMEVLKGAHVLLEAIGQLKASLHARLRVTLAGDGRERARLETEARTRFGAPSRRAVEKTESSNSPDVRFVGWLSPAKRAALFQTAHLLVVPSIWPEPLGLVGLEAAAAGVPAVAFDVGGIREWLEDGVTGRLVPAATPSAAALASTIEDCLSDPARLRLWGAAARAASRRRTLAAHVRALEDVLLRAAGIQEASRSVARSS